MMLPEFRALYTRMQTEDGATRQRSYLASCGKLTNLQRAELVTELFSPKERTELVALLAEHKRWVQMVAVQMYCEALQNLEG